MLCALVVCAPVVGAPVVGARVVCARVEGARVVGAQSAAGVQAAPSSSRGAVEAVGISIDAPAPSVTQYSALLGVGQRAATVTTFHDLGLTALPMPPRRRLMGRYEDV